MSLTNDLLTQMLNEERVEPRVAVEDFILPAIGVRRVSMLLVPAELPHASDLFEGIDRAFSRRYFHSRGRTALSGLRLGVMRALMPPLRYKASLIREAYEEVVLEGGAYRTHRAWAKRLGLEDFEQQVRPSLDEMYLTRDPEGLAEVGRLATMRDELRRAALSGDKPASAASYVLPEHRSPDFLRAQGRVLGYPDCCVEAYVADTLSGLVSDLRASNQLAELAEEGGEVPAEAYFAGGFVPCRPDCPAARAEGSAMLQRALEIDLRLGGRVRDLMKSNQERILRFPETMS